MSKRWTALTSNAVWQQWSWAGLKEEQHHHQQHPLWKRVWEAPRGNVREEDTNAGVVLRGGAVELVLGNVAGWPAPSPSSRAASLLEWLRSEWTQLMAAPKKKSSTMANRVHKQAHWLKPIKRFERCRFCGYSILPGILCPNCFQFNHHLRHKAQFSINHKFLRSGVPKGTPRDPNTPLTRRQKKVRKERNIAEMEMRKAYKDRQRKLLAREKKKQNAAQQGAAVLKEGATVEKVA